MMFGVTTPKIHYFFNTEYDAVVFARNRSKQIKSPVVVFENNVTNSIHIYRNGEEL